MWTVLDSNSASDADSWMAWTLLEAGRLWKVDAYTQTGKALLSLIAEEDVTDVPGLGLMLLPGRIGFVKESEWRFNPSYLPPQLARYFTRYGPPWNTLHDTNFRLLRETAPKGFSPDWSVWKKDRGWQLTQRDDKVGSYDAIRVYLWIGMMHDDDPQKAGLLAHFKPMSVQTQRKGTPPEKVNTITGAVISENGPVGFSAAMLPFLQDRDAQAQQRKRVLDNFPQRDAYYSYVLTLFG